ncbi:MAG: hypothetical protein JW725_03510 [Candidatus Babeliaceae bacterium]|nr:hypothetical protein [Candidatus Babeliaceae bacterium]
MVLRGTRIRNLSRRFSIIAEGSTIICGLTELNRFNDRLALLGLTMNSNDGETILPSASFGPISRYNSEGREIIHRDQPMETAYHQAEWHWEEWHGRYDRIEQSRIVDVPHQRYPRTFDPPPSIEITIATTDDSNRLLISERILFIPDNYNRILHTVNLFLEIFGECNVMDQNLNSICNAPIRRLNWTILPQGRMPWSRLNNELTPLIERQPQGNQPVIRYRFQSVNAHNPEFVAVGRYGFDGYVIFAFPANSLFILECVNLGNATYVFGNNWETLSQMTKSQILSNDYQRDRLIHTGNWEGRLNSLFQ